MLMSFLLSDFYVSFLSMPARRFGRSPFLQLLLTTKLLLLCVSSLQVKLAEQADIAVEASARAEQLEEDLAGLRAEVAQVRPL
jgi:hypothetical protein